MIHAVLDQFQAEELIPASRLHAQTRLRHGKDYQTPGYYLRLYRQRADITQVMLSSKVGMLQHHLSEMENNKRPIGKPQHKNWQKY